MDWVIPIVIVAAGVVTGVLGVAYRDWEALFLCLFWLLAALVVVGGITQNVMLSQISGMIAPLMLLAWIFFLNREKRRE